MKRVGSQPIRVLSEYGVADASKYGGSIVGAQAFFDLDDPRYSELLKVLGQPAPKPPVTMTQRLMAKLGPPLWAKLHTWALTADLSTADKWILAFVALVPCGECRREMKAILKEMPPPTDSNDSLFRWSIDVHNRVNRKLGKPEMSLDDARRRWIPPQTPAPVSAS